VAVKDEWMEHHDDVLGAISSLISSDLLVEHCRYETMRIYIFFLARCDVQVFRWRASRPGDSLDKRVKNRNQRDDGPMTNSMWIKQQWFYFSIAFLGSYMLASTCWSLVASSRIGTSTIKDARFDSIKWKSAVMMLNGCPVVEFDSASADISVVHEFSEPIEINGITLTFPGFSDGQVSDFFQVIGNSTSETGGSVVVSSDWHWNDRGVRFLTNVVRLRQTMTLDFRPPWPWYLEYALTSFLIAIMLVCVGVGGLLRSAARTSLCGCVLLAAIHCVATAGYLSLALNRQAFLTAAYALIWASASLVLALAPSFFDEACACLGAASVLARVASDCIVFRDCWNLAAMPPICEIAVTALGTALVVARYFQLSKVVRELAQDRATYDAVWRLMLESEGFEASERRLDELARRATGALSSVPPAALHPLEVEVSAGFF
jgi:hypothetical protein